MTRNVTTDAANPDKTTPVGADKLMIIDTETEPDSLKEITLTNIAAWLASLVQTLTNKTLTAPTLTNKTSTGTDSGTETLTNKTLTAPTIADFTNAPHDHGDTDDGGSLVASITLTTPTIASLTNAQHNHTNAAGGGALTSAALSDATPGTYTPTLTNTTNVDSATATGPFLYIRLGNFVLVSGAMAVDPTAAANTVVGISLPIASNFTATPDGNGNGTSQINNTVASIIADSTNDRMTFTFQAPVTTSMAWRLMFMFEIK